MNEVAIAAVDALGAAFLSGDPDAVLRQFAPTGDVVYAGSETGEVAVGRDGVRALLEELFDRDERYAWHTTSMTTAGGGAVLYVVADTTLTVHPHQDGVTARQPTEQVPYRVTGVLERDPEHWRWRMCHGSEPTRS